MSSSFGNRKLHPGSWYCVAQKIVVRGEPRTEAIVLRGSYFVRETKSLLVFVGFALNKNCIVRIEEDRPEARARVEYLESMLKGSEEGMPHD